MLRSIKSLIGFTMGATDGEIGKVKDFYFDDQTWKIRYLVLETGNWLFGRKVLLSPVSLQTPNWDAKIFPVNLTKDQIKHSPDIDADQPISREQEDELHSHYAWPYYEGAGVGFMTTGMIGGVVAPGIPFEERISDEVHHHEDEKHPVRERHLRNVKRLSGYDIHATDAVLGVVEDLIVDDGNWTLPGLVIEAGNWYSGNKILISTKHVQKIEWEVSEVYVDLTSDDLKHSPEFTYDKPINEDFIRKTGI
ncbi:PRC-barrel domain-containing protein [Pedobacter sp. P351]|uniref:PRC-barrel domain-containing protein n=1 Tax=Pedobacter superstes TaxID=3133441 RepID=UPI00309BF053